VTNLSLCFRSPDVDYDVRWCVLKLADLVIRGVEETAPKFTIHLPPTPVIESAPPLPLAKPPLKVQRTLKSGGPPVKSPLVPITVPSKVRFPGSSHTNAAPKAPRAPVPEVKKGVTFTIPAAPVKGKTKKPKANKPAHVPKAQSGGMSFNDLRACQTALRKLKLDKHAPPFLQPVDPIRDHAPK
jgi:transcription initiation factor TFIID subunit 2